MGLSFLIDGEQLKVLSDRKVIKKSDYGAAVNAKVVLDAAQAESQRLIEDAAAEVVRRREQGYRDGWQQAQDRLSEELIRIAARQALALQRQRARMARTALAVARQLVDSLDATLLFDQALRKVSEHVRAERFLSVRVAPSDVTAATEAVHRLMVRCASPRFVDVMADPSLAPLSCVVESDMGLVDASLDSFLQRLEQALHELYVAPERSAAGTSPAADAGTNATAGADSDNGQP